jgi:hypothetical protein
MSSGHASHKGTSIKPNTNTNSQIDADPQEIAQENGYPFNAQGTVVNPAATERASSESEDDKEQAQ